MVSKTTPTEIITRLVKLCFNCRQPGHIVRNCPQIAKVNNINVSDEPYQHLMHNKPQAPVRYPVGPSAPPSPTSWVAVVLTNQRGLLGT
jgi:hypothetical protein